MSKFEVGERVRHEKFGFGTVLYIVPEPQPYAVKFDKFMYGHSCEKKCEYGYGWYCEESELTKLRKVSPRKKRPAYWITTFDDRIALMGRGGKVLMTSNFYENTSHRNQQAKRWAKALGIEVRK